MRKLWFSLSILMTIIGPSTNALGQSIDNSDQIELHRQMLENVYSKLTKSLAEEGLKRNQVNGLPLSAPRIELDQSNNPLPFDLTLDAVEWNGNEFVVKLTGSFDKLMATNDPRREMGAEYLEETLDGQWEPLGITEKVRFLVRFDQSAEYFQLLRDRTPEEEIAWINAGIEAEQRRQMSHNSHSTRSKDLPLGGILAGKKIAVSGGHGWVQGIHWQPDYSGTSFGLQRSANCKFDPDVEGIIEDYSNAKFVNQWLIPLLENMGAEVITTRELDFSTDAETVIDNGGDGFSASGNWIESTYAGDGSFRFFYGKNTTVSNDPNARATWTKTFSTSGWRRFEAWYGEEGDRSSKVKYTIKDAGGEHIVYVNQRVHGRFRDLGKYWCAAGVPCSVTVENVANDGYLVADAIKMRSGKETVTGKNYPWWQMDAYYYIHRYVLNTTSEIATYSTSIRREYAIRSKADLILSVHSNASNGNCSNNTSGGAQGLWIYSPASPTGATKLYGSMLRRSILDSLWDNFDPNFCSMGGLHEKALGEINTSAIPAILVEMAYHDNLTKRSSCSVGDDSVNTGKVPRYSDNEALHMPQFREAMARGIADGIGQYFAITAKGGSASDYQKFAFVPPARPTGVRAINNVADSSLTVSWNAVDGADGYMIYKIDNLRPSFEGAWDGGTFVKNGTSYTFTGLEPGRVYAFKVSGVNKNGEGYTSPSVVARLNGVGHAKKGLYINGFTRWDAKVTHEVNTLEYASQHGIALGAVADDFYFDGAMADAVENGSVGLNGYHVVDFETGRNNGKDDTVTSKMQNVLTTYMNAGGNLLISGAEIGWALVSKGGGKSFFNDVLKGSFNDAQDDANVFAASGTGAFSALGSITFDDGSHGTYKVLYPDAFTPGSGSAAVINYAGSSVSGAAAIASDHVVMIGFPVETIYPDQKRADVVGCSIRKMVYGEACDPAKHVLNPGGANTTTANGSEPAKKCDENTVRCFDDHTSEVCKNGDWVKVACGDGKVCSNNQCSAVSEHDPVDPSDQNKCQDGAVVCKDDTTINRCENGAWTAYACDEGEKCANNACSAVSSDVPPENSECKDGEVVCSDDYSKLECVNGAWNKVECGKLEQCIDNTCKTVESSTVCEDGAVRCKDNSTVKICENGQWGELACNSGFACRSGECIQLNSDAVTNPGIVGVSHESCSATPIRKSSSAPAALTLFGIIGLMLARRRRSTKP